MGSPERLTLQSDDERKYATGALGAAHAALLAAMGAYGRLPIALGALVTGRRLGLE
jgi:hypothetical protein